MQTNLNPDGSMREMDRSSGTLYRDGADGSFFHITPHQLGISNTLVWDEARGMMVFGDTLRQTLFRIDWPIVEDMPKLKERAVTREHGFPDGYCIDEDGFVWNARYAGGSLNRFSPDGSIDRQMELPATNIAACRFGGPDLRKLCVITATNQLNDEKLKSPNERALLAPDAGGRGPRGYRFDV